MKYNLSKNLIKIIYYFLAFSAVIVLSTVSISFSSFISSDTKQKIEFFEPIIKKLLRKGVDSSFIWTVLADRRTKFNEKYVKINVTGYLKPVDYSKNYNHLSVMQANKFIRENKLLLDKCEIETGIPKEIITSILWVETKHGNYLGNHHIPSVFFSTAMADQPQFVEMNIKELHESFKGDSSELKKLEDKIRKRASKKSDWAINEIVYLEKIYNISPMSVLDIYGSWAGAFGLPQFLPSSYVRWAVDGNYDGSINLFDLEDAVFSIANYLKTNGWAESEESHKAALFHYNNSNDYVNAVLELADRMDKLPTIAMPLDQQIKPNTQQYPDNITVPGL